MPRIRFTATPKLPRDLAHLGYAKGQEHDVPHDEADKWLGRGVAEIAHEKPAPVEAAPLAAPAEPAEPEAAPQAAVEPSAPAEPAPSTSRRSRGR